MTSSTVALDDPPLILEQVLTGYWSARTRPTPSPRGCQRCLRAAGGASASSSTAIPSRRSDVLPDRASRAPQVLTRHQS